jgi:hypothetical protein
VREQCLGQNYARNEATFLLVRLLQEFDTFTLAPDAHPEGSLPPPEWQNGTGREPKERICPQYALTLFVKVSYGESFKTEQLLIDGICFQGGLWVRFGKADHAS